MALCRVYLFTYQRNELLARSVLSIRNQTFRDWICEIHNDDPLDRYPEDFIASLNDDRFIVKNHRSNSGGAASFNLAFSDSEERYSSLLEDDNWWEPDFLEVMIQSLEANPLLKIGVANERIWKEENDGSWTDLKRTVWSKTSGLELYIPDPAARCGSTKICNSAMVWKTKEALKWLTPSDLPVDVTEHFRARVIKDPILILYAPLVNFAQTIRTNRSKDRITWGAYQSLLIASVFRSFRPDLRADLAANLWKVARETNSPFKTSLLNAALTDSNAAILLKQATFKELVRYSLTWIKSPVTCLKIIRSPARYPAHWQFLLENT